MLFAHAACIAVTSAEVIEWKLTHVGKLSFSLENCAITVSSELDYVHFITDCLMGRPVNCTQSISENVPLHVDEGQQAMERERRMADIGTSALHFCVISL